MHELGIAQEIIEIVSEQSRGARVRRVVLEIGKLSMVLPDALRFCFPLCGEGTVAEGAKLVVIETPGRARCRACGAEVVLEKPFGQCSCGNTDLEWLSGEELRIKEMEVAWMCSTCGCSDNSQAKLTDPQTGASVALGEVHDHDHAHPHHHHDHGDGHGHPHDHDHAHGTVITLEREILAKNNKLAERNRGWLAGRRILALNLVSSPGAGKTTLLERTIRDLADELPLHVIEGDQETDQDARRIQAAGARVVQINTGIGCHLDAAMVDRALEQLDPPLNAVVLIENVGNLVCPALFDLGERAKVLVVSVTEGEDKPLKYPHMFRASQLLILNKIDLLPHVPFDRQRFQDFARQVNPSLHVLEVSATRGEGLAEWYAWLRARVGLAAASSSQG